MNTLSLQQCYGPVSMPRSAALLAGVELQRVRIPSRFSHDAVSVPIEYVVCHVHHCNSSWADAAIQQCYTW
jgi:hypothetical protein